MKILEIKTKEELESLNNDYSRLAIEGVAPVQANYEYLEKWFKEKNALEGEFQIYLCGGKTMNELCEIKTDPYPDDLTIMIFENIDIEKISFLEKRNLGMRWLDDIIDNNRRKENNGMA